MAERIECNIDSLHDPRIKSLVTGLLELVEFVCGLDALPDPLDVAGRQVPEARRDALNRLSDLHTRIGARAVCGEAERLPEELLVLRLRAFGTTWATIAEATDLSDGQLYKR